MFLLIEHGVLYDPTPRGPSTLLVANDRVERIGPVDRRHLDALGIEYDTIDASGCVVVPGFIDPHEHLLGGSGEGGLALQSPMVFLREIVRAGVTTVVGVLGVDTTMKTLPGLLARVKALTEEGMSARMWSGGYNVPPTTLMASVREDMLFVEEVIGAGEIAISDERGLNQSTQELAKLVRDTHVGGLLSRKAGVTHFHVGEECTRLAPLRELVEDFQVKPEWLYPTHIERSEALMREAIDFANEGSFVDIDVVEQDLARWFTFYIENGGPLDKLTVSSDADSATPDMLMQQICELIVRHNHTLDLVLPLVTRNTATVLKLDRKGVIQEGKDADVLILERDTLAVREVIARGRRMVTDGEPVVREKFLAESHRNIDLVGDRFGEAPP